jgi:sec-independent protein translocase protein TatA
MPGFVGLPEILLLGLVVLLVFGPKRLPEMGRSMGRGFREFRDSISGDKNDERDRFAVPAEEPNLTLAAATQDAPVVATPSPEPVVSERSLARFARDDEQVA